MLCLEKYRSLITFMLACSALANNFLPVWRVSAMVPCVLSAHTVHCQPSNQTLSPAWRQLKVATALPITLQELNLANSFTTPYYQFVLCSTCLSFFSTRACPKLGRMESKSAIFWTIEQLSVREETFLGHVSRMTLYYLHLSNYYL